jgi:hypothetical protein
VGDANSSGSGKLVIGRNSGRAIITAKALGGNTFMGCDAGSANINGIGNAFIGRQAGELRTTANITFAGSEAGKEIQGQGGTYFGTNTEIVYRMRSFNVALGWFTHINGGAIQIL